MKKYLPHVITFVITLAAVVAVIASIQFKTDTASGTMRAELKSDK